jgi:hypothetical protein
MRKEYIHREVLDKDLISQNRQDKNDVQLKRHQPIRRLLSHSIGSQHNEKKKKKKKKEKKDSRKTQDKTETEPFSASAKGKRQKIHVLNTRSCPNRPNQTKPKNLWSSGNRLETLLVQRLSKPQPNTERLMNEYLTSFFVLITHCNHSS